LHRTWRGGRVVRDKKLQREVLLLMLLLRKKTRTKLQVCSKTQVPSQNTVWRAKQKFYNPTEHRAMCNLLQCMTIRTIGFMPASWPRKSAFRADLLEKQGAVRKNSTVGCTQRTCAPVHYHDKTLVVCAQVLYRNKEPACQLFTESNPGINTVSKQIESENTRAHTKAAASKAKRRRG